MPPGRYSLQREGKEAPMRRQEILLSFKHAAALPACNGAARSAAIAARALNTAKLFHAASTQAAYADIRRRTCAMALRRRGREHYADATIYDAIKRPPTQLSHAAAVSLREDDDTISIDADRHDMLRFRHFAFRHTLRALRCHFANLMHIYFLFL